MMKKILSVLSVIIFFLNLSAQNDFSQKLSDAALSLTRTKVTYDPAYVVLTYPNGDVAACEGVCTDVIIRAYRKLGIDLQ